MRERDQGAAIAPLFGRGFERKKNGAPEQVQDIERFTSWCHLVSALHQRVAQARDDAFGTTVQPRWHGLMERGDLRDLHGGCDRMGGAPETLDRPLGSTSSTAQAGGDVHRRIVGHANQAMTTRCGSIARNSCTSPAALELGAGGMRSPFAGRAAAQTRGSSARAIKTVLPCGHLPSAGAGA